MLSIRIRVQRNGCLERLDAKGHVEGEAGSNLNCAAASFLLRSTARLLEAEGFLECHSTLGEGDFSFAVKKAPVPRAWLEGVSDLLIFGLLNLEKDASDDIFLEIVKEK